MSQPNKEPKNYVGLTSTVFKDRLAVHNNSFNNPGKCQTSLSQHIELKNQGIQPEVTWKIIDHGKPYSATTGTCNLYWLSVTLFMFASLDWVNLRPTLHFTQLKSDLKWFRYKQKCYTW